MQMKSVGLPAALLAAMLFGACSNTARGVQEDAAQNADDAREVADRAAQDAREAASDAADATRSGVERAADATRDAMGRTGAALDAAAQTAQIKTALMAEKSVDASKINVDTDGSTMTVTLKGSVPSDAQKDTAERIAKEKAPDYTVRNDLVVAR